MFNVCFNTVRTTRKKTPPVGTVAVRWEYIVSTVSCRAYVPQFNNHNSSPKLSYSTYVRHVLPVTSKSNLL